jgi:hypothetical protein
VEKLRTDFPIENDRRDKLYHSLLSLTN